MINQDREYNKNDWVYLPGIDEQPFLTHPLRYITWQISNSSDKPPPHIVIASLQNNVKEIFYIFLNYPISIGNLSCLPRIVDKYYRNKFLSLLPLVKFIYDVNGGFENFLSFLHDIKENRKRLNTYYLASMFSVFYRDFDKTLDSVTSIGIKTKEPCPYFEMEQFPNIERDKKYLMPLKLLQEYVEKHLSEYVSGFYLHGSFSTMDYVKNWSDVDTLLIVSKETLESPKKILGLQKATYKGTGFFYSIDPFQSHGFFHITEYDLHCYPETYFPVEMFPFCKSFLKNDQSFEFRIRSFQNESMHIFWKDCLDYLRNIAIEKRQINKLTNNEIRMLLHRIYIFPVFYLQAKGIHCYKKYAFDAAKGDFSQEEWEPVNTANKVWEEWNRSYGYRVIPPVLLTFSPFISNFLLKKYYALQTDAFRKYAINYELLLEKSVQLFENAWQKLLTIHCSKNI